MAWWALAYALNICSTDFSTQYFFNRIKYLGVLSVPPLWVLLALQYTRNRITFSRRFLVLVFLPTILLVPVVLTNPLTRLWWSKVWSETYYGRPVLQNSHAPLYFVLVLVNYGYLLFGSWHYVRFLQQRWQVYRSQAALILIAVIIPVGANIITQLGHSPLPWGLDTFFLSLSLFVLGIAIFRYGFLAITPIARQTILEHLPDGVIVINAYGRILDCNPAMEAIVDCESGALVGQPLESAIEDRALRECLLEVIQAYRQQDARRDIHLYDRAFTVTATSLDRAVGKVLLLQDITERLKVQAELEASYRQAHLERERLALTIRTATDAIFLLDANGGILASNPAASRLIEVERIDQFPLPIREVLVEVREEQQIVQREVEYGESVFHATAAPLFTDGPEDASGQVLTMHDITHFRHLAELKDDFVSTVSHDLRAPLTSILGFAQIARREAPAGSLIAESLQQIEQAADRMADLINDLLDLANMQAGLKRDTIPVNMSSLAKTVVKELKGSALAKELAVHQELDPQTWVNGDLRLLTQLWSNLLGNAIKYTHNGSITVHTSRDNHAVRCSVADTGIGISPSEIPYLFDKFYRSQHPQVQDLPGDGLGLAFCKLIVEQHGGRIWVDSEPGVGSTFSFSIPMLTGTPVELQDP
jgi:PAS domain S-box-containing protein